MGNSGATAASVVSDQTLQRILDLLQGQFGEDLPLPSDQRVQTTSGPAWVLPALAAQGRPEARVRVSKVNGKTKPLAHKRP